MYSMTKLGAGREYYYLTSVANGAEDYYLGRGEAPGTWVGAGSAALGLSGTVAPEALAAVLDGRHPGGASLVGAGTARRVRGFDLTFSAPKLVSVVWAIGDPGVSGVVRATHDDAVGEALAYPERQALAARRQVGAGGRRLRRGT